MSQSSNTFTEHSIVPVELTLMEWQSVIGVLDERGIHRVVAPLITKIGQQVQRFAQANNPQAS